MIFRFHVQARQEYRQAALYYAERGRSLGQEFILRVEQVLASGVRWTLPECGRYS